MRIRSRARRPHHRSDSHGVPSASLLPVTVLLAASLLVGFTLGTDSRTWPNGSPEVVAAPFSDLSHLGSVGLPAEEVRHVGVDERPNSIGSSDIASVPTCRACAWKKVKWCGRVRRCADSEFGSKTCYITLPHKYIPCGTCKDDGPLCEGGVIGMIETERALEAFASGRMLRADGHHYIGVRGDELVLRQKCGGSVVARLPIADVGSTSAWVLAGG